LRTSYQPPSVAIANDVRPAVLSAQNVRRPRLLSRAFALPFRAPQGRGQPDDDGGDTARKTAAVPVQALMHHRNHALVPRSGNHVRRPNCMQWLARSEVPMATRGCVVLVMPQQWERAILRAELIERGHDVVGMRHLGDLLAFHAAEAGHAPIGVVLVDRTAFAGRHHRLLSILRRRHRCAPFVLLARAMTEVADCPWNAVLVRPLSVAQLADKIAALLALAPSAGEGVPPTSCRDPSTN